MVLEESSICVSCLYKQSSFLFGLRSNYFSIRSSHPGPRRYRPILRPIFLIVRFHSFIYSFNIIQFITLLIQEPLTVERRRGRLASSTAGSINRGRINTLTGREPLAFEQNTGYTNRGRGRGRSRPRGCPRGRRGSAQTSNRGGTSQISSGTALQTTAQSTQSTQKQVGGTTGGKNGSGS